MNRFIMRYAWLLKGLKRRETTRASNKHSWRESYKKTIVIVSFKSQQRRYKGVFVLVNWAGHLLHLWSEVQAFLL